MTEAGEGIPEDPGTAQATRRPPRGMRPWMGCLASLLLALVCLCPTWTLLWLGLRGDIVLSAGQPGEIRLWLARANQGAALAMSISRPTPSSLGDDCLQTRVRFLPLNLVPGPEAAAYCICSAKTGKSVTQLGACPP